MDNQDGLEALGKRLAERIIQGLGTRSAWALRAAVDAGETPDIAGIIVIKVPPKNSDRLDITFTIGTVDVTTRWDVA